VQLRIAKVKQTTTNGIDIIGKSANIVVYRVGIPPSAGVIGANRKSGCLKNGIPPACGGYR
ncbi:hypothetical protein AB7B85_29535, partial [Klebsiella pneumoniae]